MPSYQIKQSSTAYPLVFLMIDSADHLAAKTGLSPTVTVRKVGGSFATPTGAVTEIANGWYQVAGNATDSATLGPLLLHATATGADPTDMLYEVVAHDVQDAVRLGLTAMPNAAAAASGGLPTIGVTIPNATAGAAGGLFIAGTNAATTVTTAFTSTFTGNLTGSVASVTGAVNSVTTGVTRAASQHVIVDSGTVTTVTNQLAGSAIATAVWQDATAGDFTVTSSIGKNLKADDTTPGSANGHFIAGTNAATTITTSLTTHLVGTVDTVTTLTNLPAIPANWLTGTGTDATAVTKIQSGLATPTNITAGTITTVTNLTNAPTVGDLTAAMIASVTTAATAATPAVASVASPVSISLTQTLNAARALDAIADTSIEVNDALQCAVAAAAGRETIVGTVYTIRTPFTATVLRTFTLDSATAPASRT